eukprot:TRINITY_DN5910_c0_g1_i1.p1 TRINITY_DN5910_c0_g1~~TRINITY_DN5910_c0_g1_i1.p1  ORF type:complete len:142 (-),score=33.16 TRINITY_DN5910_c0_g1_i1:359-784(-)
MTSLEDQLSIVEEANTQLWNLDLEKAINVLQKFSSTSPLLSVKFAQAAFLKGFLSEDEKDCQACFNQLEDAAKLASNTLNQFKKEHFSKLSIADKLLYLSCKSVMPSPSCMKVLSNFDSNNISQGFTLFEKVGNVLKNVFP